MERQHIRFYIDRNDKLRCIWYKERSWRWRPDITVFVHHSMGGFEENGVSGFYKNGFDHDFPDGQYAVRSVPIKRSCDKHSICKVRYCYTEEEAKAIIDQRLLRNKPATPDTITWNHLFQLAKCPKKYVTWFMNYIKEFYGEEEQERMAQCLIKASHKQELMDQWRLEEIHHRVCQLFQED